MNIFVGRKDGQAFHVFNSVEQAESKLAELQQADPEGANAGQYLLHVQELRQDRNLRAKAQYFGKLMVRFVLEGDVKQAEIAAKTFVRLGRGVLELGEIR